MKKTKSRIIGICSILCLVVCLSSVFGCLAFAADAAKNYTVDTASTMTVVTESGQTTLYEKKLMCDITGDGKFNSADAAGMLRVAARIAPAPENVEPFDLDGDGRLKAIDARMALRYCAKLDKYYVFEDERNAAGFLGGVDGGSYYFDEYGALARGYRLIGEDGYLFNESTGLMTTGFSMYRSAAANFGADGKGVSGLTTVDGKTYLFDRGLALTGFREVGGKKYYFSSDGSGADGIVAVGKITYGFRNGALVSGWQNFGGKYYYINSDGTAANGKVRIDGSDLWFDNGLLCEGIKQFGGKSYFFVSGEMKTGWQQVAGNWYYFAADGVMALGKKIIDGKIYNFGSNGISQTGRTGSEPKIAVIGDSIVASLAIHLSAEKVDFYGKVSLHANTIFNKKASGSSRYIIDEVTGRGYDKVIILLGINDLTYGDKAWGEMYRKIIQGVKQRSPGSEVLAHAITPVNDGRSRANGYATTMTAVRNKNAVIQRIAAEEGVRYIDPSPVMTDANGQLPYEAASDGIHFGAKYCKIWLDWMYQTV